MKNTPELSFIFNRYFKGSVIYRYTMWTIKPGILDWELEKLPQVSLNVMESYDE